MTDDELEARLGATYATCARTIGWRRPSDPAAAFAGLARACEELGIDEWDVYAEHGAVERLEREVRELLGKPAAAFFPSGIMAQQAALRVHTERAGCPRVALPDLSHLLVHEEDAVRVLQGLRVETLTRGFTAPHADHLQAIPGRLGAVLVELPLRDAGCLLPSYDDLAGLSAACRRRGVALHLDGARLWESVDFLGHTLADIAALGDTVYVSFYKGLGGLAGAMLLGEEDVIAEARLWRRRMGGTIFRNTAMVVSALAGLRDRLGVIPACVHWARAFAAALPDAITVQPPIPHTNQFLAYASVDPAAVNARLLAYTQREDLALGGAPWYVPAKDPGRAMTEFIIGDGALELDPVETATLVGDLVAGA